MASDITFVEYVCDQIRGAGGISHRAMFGEFAVYRDGKVIGLVCDNQFFVKPTQAGRALLGMPVEAPPYPGARPHFLVSDQLDDRDLMTGLIRATAAELPTPKPRKKAAPKK